MNPIQFSSLNVRSNYRTPEVTATNQAINQLRYQNDARAVLRRLENMGFDVNIRLKKTNSPNLVELTLTTVRRKNAKRSTDPIHATKSATVEYNTQIPKAIASDIVRTLQVWESTYRTSRPEQSPRPVKDCTRRRTQLV